MKYFTIKELCQSSTATQKGIDNTPNSEIVSNLEQLVDKVLDPLREEFGESIIVNSGYRSPALNKAVKGAANSQHVFGQAADITTNSKVGNKRLFTLAQTLDLPFDQLIDEKNYSWIHISYSPRNRKQVLHL